MKKTVCAMVLVCVLLVSLTAGAAAQTVEPLMPGLLRELVAGKTFIAAMEGYACDEAMEKATLYFRISEQETYKAEDVKALQTGDTLVVGGSDFVIQAIEQDEFGYYLTGEDFSIFLSANDDGLYYAVGDTEERFYRTICSIEIPASADLLFLDWSDPEADDPTELTLKDLLTRYANEEIHSMEDNTEITFDENGKLVSILYRYSPWN